MNPLSLLAGGALSPKSSASGATGDQAQNIEQGLTGQFIVGDGNRTGSAVDSLTAYMPYALAALGLAAVVVYLRRR